VAFWWQLHRALDGNDLSWAYTFEWPLFAALSAVMWWQQVHEDPARIEAGAPIRPASPPEVPQWSAGEDDPEMAAYNRYLAELASSGRRRSWRGS